MPEQHGFMPREERLEKPKGRFYIPEELRHAKPPQPPAESPELDAYFGPRRTYLTDWRPVVVNVDAKEERHQSKGKPIFLSPSRLHMLPETDPDIYEELDLPEPRFPAAIPSSPEERQRMRIVGQLRGTALHLEFDLALIIGRLHYLRLADQYLKPEQIARKFPSMNVTQVTTITDALNSSKNGYGRTGQLASREGYGWLLGAWTTLMNNHRFQGSMGMNAQQVEELWLGEPMMQAGARLAWLWDVFFGTHLDPSEFTFPHPFRQDSNFRLEEKTAAMIPLTDPETGKDVTVMFAYIPDILCGGNFSVLHTMSEEEIPSNPGAVTAFDFKTSLPYATADPMADLTASLQRTVAIEHNLHSPVGANFVGCRNGRRSWSPMDFCDPEDAASRAGTVVYTNISPRQTPDGRNVFENCTMTVPGHLDFSPESPYHKAIAHIASRLGDPRRNTPTRKRPKLITPDIRGPDYQPVLPGF